MLTVLLLFALLFQAGATPIVDNDRVTVSKVNGAAPPQPLDAVLVSLSGHAAWVPRGSTPHAGGPAFLIDLKDHAVAPIANPTKYPLAFPRNGAKKLIDNPRVTVWDYSWTPNVPGQMHFHDKDVVVVFLEDGDLKSTTPDGKSVVVPHSRGSIVFNGRDRTHFETLVSGKQRAIITELK